MQTHLHVTERLTGFGTVSILGRVVAGVSYEVTVNEQAVFCHYPGDNPEDIPIARTASGILKVMDGEIPADQGTDELVLHLNDGRRLTFCVGSTSEELRQCQIEAASGPSH